MTTEQKEQKEKVGLGYNHEIQAENNAELSNKAVKHKSLAERVLAEIEENDVNAINK